MHGTDDSEGAAGEATSRNLMMLVQFDGTGFAGWQRQDGLDTIQGHLEQAVESMVRHPVQVRSTSRTDAGVHARGMPAQFTTDRDIPCEGFQRGLNTLLPSTIAVLSVEERPPGWLARHAAVAKTYTYRFLTGPSRRPLGARERWYLGSHPFDGDAMRRASDLLLGSHDFSSFRSSACVSKTAVRHIHEITVEERERGEVDLTVIGNAFLHNMVRIIAGTLSEVALGRRTPESLEEVLAARDRRRAGITAPAHGLTLERVHFDGYPALGKPTTYEVPPHG